MHAQRSSFLQVLQLPPDLSEEECTSSVSNLIALAIGDQPQPTSLKEIYAVVVRYDCADYIEPLDVLPILFPCRHEGALDLIRLCGIKHSPKELMIVIQAAIEQLQSSLDDQGDEDDERVSDLVQKTIGVSAICSLAISRSRLGRKSALETCSPVLESLASVISAVSPFATKAEGRLLVIEVSRLVKTLGEWTSVNANAAEATEIKDLLRDLLDATVMGCAPTIQACLAARAIESQFPRFSARSSVSEGWQEGEKAMSEVQNSRQSVWGLSLKAPPKFSSLIDLMYLAHSTPTQPFPPSILTDLHPLLVQSLQMNVMVDESLFLLFITLTQENVQISPEVAISLCTVLPALASTNLDSFIRQLTLRLLSRTLAKLPPAPRLKILLDLTTDKDFPQIRGPAVGLVKEAVLEALTLSGDTANPFASPELLRVFGGVLFVPNPPEFFEERKTKEELAGSLELLRIADCLSFYYILLQRDRENKTEVRSRDNVTSVENTFIRPLRRFLDEHLAHEEQPLMAVLSLQVGLDRIDDALRILDVSS